MLLHRDFNYTHFSPYLENGTASNVPFSFSFLGKGRKEFLSIISPHFLSYLKQKRGKKGWRKEKRERSKENKKRKRLVIPCVTKGITSHRKKERKKEMFGEVSLPKICLARR
jgi:hypothetical protein